MMRVGIRELRQNATGVLARVRAGEVVTVTDRGRPVARICPEPESDWDALIESGQLRPPVGPVPLDQVLPLPGDVSGSSLLDALRADER